MIVGFFGMLFGLFYLVAFIFVVWLAWRAVAALEQTASAQQRSAEALAEISRTLSVKD